MIMDWPSFSGASFIDYVPRPALMQDISSYYLIFGDAMIAVQSI